MKKTILFVEDETVLQKTLGDALELKGYNMLQALNGEDGWQLAKKSKPDLILLDLILPKKDGFEVLSELKQNEETKNIPVIVLTNLENAQDIERVLALGVTTFLVKTNYELDEIVEKIEKTLNS